MPETKDVLEAALKLAPAERVRLLEEVSASLDAIDLGDEWEAEIQNRMDDVDAGRVKTLPGDEVISRLRQRFGGR